MKKPIFRIVKNGTTTIALSSFAGKTVKAIAKLDPRDSFDPSMGEKLAKARCETKICLRRVKWAEKLVFEAQDVINKAYSRYNRLMNYYEDALVAANDATKRQIEIEHALRTDKEDM